MVDDHTAWKTSQRGSQGSMLALFPSATSTPIGQCPLDAEGAASLGTELGGPAGKMKTPLTSPGQHQLRDRYRSQTDGEKSISATTGKASLGDRTRGQIHVTGDHRRGWGGSEGSGAGLGSYRLCPMPSLPCQTAHSFSTGRIQGGTETKVDVTFQHSWWMG